MKSQRMLRKILPPHLVYRPKQQLTVIDVVQCFSNCGLWQVNQVVHRLLQKTMHCKNCIRQ
jgi:hypothetical protein